MSYDRTLDDNPRPKDLMRKHCSLSLIRTGPQEASMLPIPIPAPRYHPHRELLNFLTLVPASLHNRIAFKCVDLSGNTSWHFAMIRWRPVPPPLLTSTRSMHGRIVIRSQLDAARSSAK
eukprot:633286-Pyramimonas_sp.AAC.2